MADISGLDLNLLPVLRSLLHHRSVTLAARELGMSQSAVSMALARLRGALGDQLLVRAGRGMLPTPRATALVEVLPTILEMVRDHVLSANGFVASESQRRFVVALSDVGSYVLWPRIVAAIESAAPRVQVGMRTLPQLELASALENGEVDLALGAYPDLPPTLYQRRLFERQYVALVGKQHPLAGKRLGIKAFAQVPQAVVRLASGIQDRVDDVLLKHGYKRERVLEMPSYLMLPPLLEDGCYLAVMPGQLADAFSRHGRFTSLKLPFELPTSTIRMHWHRRYHEDAGNVWLRGVVVDAFTV